MIVTALSFLFVIGLLVFFHELGHFLLAKSTGMQVTEFAFGLPPRVTSIRRKETRYALNLVPLGGYVKIVGIEPGEENLPNSFYKKPLWQRFLTLLAGSAMNFVLAMLLFFFVGMIFGKPKGDTNELASIIKNYPAEQAGLRVGDKIVGVNDFRSNNVKEIRKRIEKSPEKPVKLIVLRNGKEFALTITPKAEYTERLVQKTVIRDHKKIKKAKLVKEKVGRIGVGFKRIVEKMGFFESLKAGILDTAHYTVAFLWGLKETIFGKLPLEVKGPVGIMQLVGETTKWGGLSSLLWLTGVISIWVGLFNLFPFPALDGGRIGFLTFELFRLRPIDRKKENMIHTAGLILLLFLVFVITCREILQWLKLLP